MKARKNKIRMLLCLSYKKCIGAVIGVVAGATIALTQDKPVTEEQHQAEQQKEQTQQQIM